MISIEALYNLYLKHKKISTDTRNISEGSLFFALKGDNFNGNQFAGKALASGAAFAIVDEEEYVVNGQTLLVDDVLTALQDLAKQHRSNLSIPVIGLTGSNGKTTTKELLNSVLSKKFKTYATKGNLNNHIGVPLSILEIDNSIELGIIEMGANHQKEIAHLCTIAQPTHGLITNIGKAHLEGFGGFEGVKKGKGELYDWLELSKGIVFVYRNNKLLLEMSKAISSAHFYYGSEGDHVSGRFLAANPYLHLMLTAGKDSAEFTMQITGDYNYENVMAAAAVGDFFGVELTEIKSALENYLPTNNRSQIKISETNTIICDFYNANPSSMRAALENLKGQGQQNKVAILGDMFELGEESLEQHQTIIDYALATELNQVFFIGKSFSQLKRADAQFYETTMQAIEALKVNRISNAFILLKGSRGMALEQLLPLL